MVFFSCTRTSSKTGLLICMYMLIILLDRLTMVGRSKGNKQVDKNAAKEKSSDSSKHKKKAQRRHNLGGGRARGKSKRQE
jgi:hypothetical protein